MILLSGCSEKIAGFASSYGPALFPQTPDFRGEGGKWLLCRQKILIFLKNKFDRLSIRP
ncbi:hypothetical protein EMIT0P258_60242 [Pseudomonas sp. IT-P258]